MRKLYKKYAGKRITVRISANDSNLRGVVCGYSGKDFLIIAVTEGTGWTCMDKLDVVVTCIDNPNGYYYIFEKDINKFI